MILDRLKASQFDEKEIASFVHSLTGEGPTLLELDCARHQHQQSQKEIELLHKVIEKLVEQRDSKLFTDEQYESGGTKLMNQELNHLIDAHLEGK